MKILEAIVIMQEKLSHKTNPNQILVKALVKHQIAKKIKKSIGHKK